MVIVDCRGLGRARPMSGCPVEIREYGLMSECQHQWKMTNIRFGFTVFEKCAQTREVRTYFAEEDTWDQYREGDKKWTIVENAQTFRFNLTCSKCGQVEDFKDLMGLLYCTGCLADCEAEIVRQEGLKNKVFTLVAFGFLPESIDNPMPQEKLDILSEHFNQRRDTSRSTVKIVPFRLIKDVSLCKGEFIHDVGMLSLEPPDERKPLF